MRNRAILILLGVAAIVAGGVAWGLASRQPPKYPVRGTVTAADGKPAAGASVLFHPVGGKTEKVVVGKADDKGEFVLTTDQPGDGAEAGEYAVTVVWTPPRRPPGEAMAEAMSGGKPPAGMPSLPPFLKKIFGGGPPDPAKIEKMLANGPPPGMAGMAPPPGMSNALQPQDKLGGRYADPTRTTLRFTVTTGENVVPPITVR